MFLHIHFDEFREFSAFSRFIPYIVPNLIHSMCCAALFLYSRNFQKTAVKRQVYFIKSVLYFGQLSEKIAFAALESGMSVSDVYKRQAFILPIPSRLRITAFRQSTSPVTVQKVRRISTTVLIPWSSFLQRHSAKRWRSVSYTHLKAVLSGSVPIPLAARAFPARARPSGKTPSAD